MDPINIELRADREPPASAPTGGELSAAEVDGNFSALKTAIEQVNAETVKTADAAEVADGAGVVAPLDHFIVANSAFDPESPVGEGNQPFFTLTYEDLLALVLAEVPSTTPGDPATITHNGAGENPVVGDTLTAAFAGGWAGPVQWTRGGVDISGATAGTHVTVEDDAGTTVGAVIGDPAGLRFVAAGLPVGAGGGGGGGLVPVQTPNRTPVGHDTVFQQNLSVVGAGNSVVFVVAHYTGDSAPTSVVDSAANDWGSPVFLADAGDIAFRFYKRDNANGITYVRANFGAGRGGWCAAVEVSGGPIELDASGEALQTSTAAYQAAFTSTADGALCIFCIALANASSPSAVSPLDLMDTGDATYETIAAGVFPTAGANTAQIDLSSGWAGEKGWVVFKASA